MPLTKTGKRVMRDMKTRYGKKAGERVFYATRNAHKIKGWEKGKGK